ncbi:MAG: ABC transporter substrate-binding protein [Smithellaceae bacterium]
MRIIRLCLFIMLIWMMLCSAAFSGPPVRIVSMAPSITEILYDLGLGGRIVAVTDFCDYPQEANSKPKIGGFANPSLEAIIAAKPDMVIMMEEGNPVEVYNRLRKLGINTYVFRAKRLRELPQGIRNLGSVLGIEDRAARRASAIEAQLNKYARKVQQSSSRHLPKKALFIIHPEPLLVAGRGTVIDDALTLLGLQNIAADTGAPYAKYTIEEVVRRAPDVVFVGQGPMSRNSSKTLVRRLNTLESVQKGHVYYASELLYRLTPRTILGIEEIANHLSKI